MSLKWYNYGICYGKTSTNSNNVFENKGKKENNTNKQEIQLPIEMKKQSIYQKIIKNLKKNLTNSGESDTIS